MADAPDTADPAELLNLPVEFPHDGKTYKSRRLDIAEIAEFCSWLEQKATEKAWYGTANLPPEARSAVLEANAVTLGSGSFRVGGSGYLHALTQPEPGAYLLYLGLRNEHPDLTLDDCAAMFLAKYEERVRDALRGLGSPNSSGGRKGSSGPWKASSRSSKKKASRSRKR